ncbi:MAG TPA: prolipoprotein diacylglyceryl transferase [Candidatus Binatia bacterium]|nr:prolipoprotein diacylglyceryl transferase [Candidatus Binatia bacterium]
MPDVSGLIALIDVRPSPTIQIGPLPIFWYGIAYAVGLAVAYLVMSREAVRRGRNPDLLVNGMIVVAVAALAGGRLYHVIDQWQLYRDDPLKIILPPYTGLGVFGGLVTGTIAFTLLTRLWRQPFWVWADIVAPGLFAMQAVGRWGNFFNQELYGPPTDLPWGIAIDCAHRVAAYPCDTYPVESTGFHPLFLYESLSGVLGVAVLLWLGRRLPHRLRAGDLAAVFFIWYGIVRFGLETLRTGNWLFFGVPTAQIFALGFIAFGIAIAVAHRLRPGPTMAEVDAAALADGAAAASRSTDEEAAGDWADDWDDDWADEATTTADRADETTTTAAAGATPEAALDPPGSSASRGDDEPSTPEAPGRRETAPDHPDDPDREA